MDEYDLTLTAFNIWIKRS